MKTWIVSSLGEETIQGGETIQGRKLYEEIRYIFQVQKRIVSMETICGNTVTTEAAVKKVFLRERIAFIGHLKTIACQKQYTIALSKL